MCLKYFTYICKRDMRGVMGTPEAHNLRQEGSIPSPATMEGLDELDEQRMTSGK